MTDHNKDNDENHNTENEIEQIDKIEDIHEIHEIQGIQDIQEIDLIEKTQSPANDEIQNNKKTDENENSKTKISPVSGEKSLFKSIANKILSFILAAISLYFVVIYPYSKNDSKKILPLLLQIICQIMI